MAAWACMEARSSYSRAKLQIGSLALCTQPLGLRRDNVLRQPGAGIHSPTRRRSSSGRLRGGDTVIVGLAPDLILSCRASTAAVAGPVAGLVGLTGGRGRRRLGADDDEDEDDGGGIAGVVPIYQQVVDGSLVVVVHLHLGFALRSIFLCSAAPCPAAER